MTGVGVSPIGLLRIDHVGIAVPALDPAIAFYERTFGMRCVHRERNHEGRVEEATMAVGPPGTGGASIQLLAPFGQESPIGRFLRRHGPGVQQIAYTVEDLEFASTQLRAQGLRLVFDAPQPGSAGSRVNFIHPKDSGGVLVELVELATDQGHSDPAAPSAAG